jgi:glutamate--cysteine ligase
MQAPTLTRQGLIETFHSYGKPRAAFRVGGEFERAVVRKDGSPVRYDDEDGIRWMLQELAARQGWEPEYEGENVIALLRDGASITLEPGGQVELSGAPHYTLSALADEMQENRDALLALAEGRDLVWIACGLTPIADIDAVDWMPKGRYRVMREYLPQVGDLAHYMMKGTCSVQANFDYEDEADCARKVHLCAGLAPLTTALFASSPLYRNRPTGFHSYRGHIWTRTDPARTGFPPGLRDAYTHERWVDYLLDAPMMFVKQPRGYVPAHGRSFRSFMEEGFEGRLPGPADWSLHQTAVFPEVRVKHTIEVRGADCVGRELALAFCGLFTGLLYCPGALDEGLALAVELEKHGDHRERLAIASRDALDGVIGGRPLADWARDLGALAERGLRNCLPGDVHLLEPLLERIEAGRSPSVDILEAWARDPSPENILRVVAY